MQSVFPARAGMSPIVSMSSMVREGVPRASGDEPALVEAHNAAVECSPRERG